MLGEPWDATDEDASPAVGEAMMSRARDLIPALAQATVESVHVALRCGMNPQVCCVCACDSQDRVLSNPFSTLSDMILHLWCYLA